MTVTVTSIKLKRWRHYFKLTYLALKIVRQTKQQKGFVKMKNTGFGYLHYTLSVWQSDADMKNFARTGAHLEAMKKSRTIADEIRIYTFQSEQMPKWKEAKQLLLEKGKVISFE